MFDDAHPGVKSYFAFVFFTSLVWHGKVVCRIYGDESGELFILFLCCVGVLQMSLYPVDYIVNIQYNL